LDKSFDSAEIIKRHVKDLLDKTYSGKMKVRLLGISISKLLRYDEHGKFKQLNFQV
jgi:hypothetical protein